MSGVLLYLQGKGEWKIFCSSEYGEKKYKSKQTVSNLSLLPYSNFFQWKSFWLWSLAAYALLPSDYSEFLDQ